MKQHNSTYLRRFMNKVFNTCEESCEPVLITTRKDGRDEPQQMVIISKAQYDKDKRELYELKATLFNKTHNDNAVLHESLNYLNK